VEFIPIGVRVIRPGGDASASRMKKPAAAGFFDDTAAKIAIT
jgi:hypothetical protein